MDNPQPQGLGLKPPGVTRRKAISLSQEQLVRTENFPTGSSLPLIVRPTAGRLNLVEWASSNRAWIEALLLEHRALLFRGFDLATEAEFARFVTVTSDGRLLEYRDRSSPRHEVGDRIYTSTDYPADQRIFLHNEGTYWLTWPLKIYFCCLTAAQQGGETPIADCRRIFERIDPAIREQFIRKQWMLVRNYNEGFGLPWQTVFQTTDRAVVDEYCRRNAIEAEWREGKRLRTRQVRPAVARHPRTGESVWFNHAAFFHVSTLEPAIRDALLAGFSEEELPYNTYYGDGSPIEADVLEALRDAYCQEIVAFPWHEGDVLALDNMTVAHGRASYVGSRTVLTGMAEPYSRNEA
jgi:alpha-ketoglutarate-dependent taurine dioxygenase